MHYAEGLRGYTGHQHLTFPLVGGTEGGLINMNARLYDPQLGRMLSPDNYVQNISNTQNFNRYNYVLNNPLKYTDPSGDLIGVAATIIAAAAIGGSTNMLISAIINPNRTAKQLVGDFAVGAVTAGISAGLGLAFSIPFGIAKGALINATTSTLTNVTGKITYNAVNGNELLDGVGQAAWKGAIIGALSGGVNGYFLSKRFHTNKWWGTWEQSLDYIMQTEYGAAVLQNDYGIGINGSNYYVGRNTNLPDDFSNVFGTLYTPDGPGVYGFVEPGNLMRGDKIIGSKVFISKSTIRGYFVGNIMKREMILHEMFHLKDYYSGYYLKTHNYLETIGVSENIIPEIMFNWQEMRAYQYNSSLNPADPYYESMYRTHFSNYINLMP